MDKLDKNISIYTFEGLTERRGQDTYNIFEVDIEGINIKAFGLYIMDMAIKAKNVQNMFQML